MDKPKYTVIMHEVRLSLKLNLTEYCVADIIYHLSNNPSSKIQGWCYASKKTIGGYIGISEQGIYKVLRKLEKENLIEKDDDTKYLRTTQKWYDNIVMAKMNIDTKQSIVTLNKVESGTKQRLVDDTKQSLVNNNNIYNNNYNINNILKDQELVSYLIEKGIPEDIVKRELMNFISYWTETNQRGKERWQGEKYFDVKRRLATWFKNCQKFNTKVGVKNKIL